MTSHDVVAILRRVLQEKRIGHSGTLDPMATGVLPVLIGKATRLAEFMTQTGKTYRFTMEFGQKTDTLDRTGNVVATSEKQEVARDELEAVLPKFTGEVEQTVPLYSAVKVKGKKLYEYARQGVAVEPPIRKVTIYGLDLLSTDGHTATLFCQCSSGTYIRQLAVDIAQRLNTVAMVTALERRRVGDFSIADTVSIKDLKRMKKEEALSYLQPADRAVKHLPELHLRTESGWRLQQGQTVRWSATAENESFHDAKKALLCRLYVQDLFLGVGTFQSGRIKMIKNITDVSLKKA